MTISPEAWDIIKMLIGAYAVFCLNKSDRNQRELFKRMRQVEIMCARNHHKAAKDDDDEDT